MKESHTPYLTIQQTATNDLYGSYISFHNNRYLDIFSETVVIVTHHEYNNTTDRTIISKSDPELLDKITNWWNATIKPQWKATSTKQ